MSIIHNNLRQKSPLHVGQGQLHENQDGSRVAIGQDKNGVGYSFSRREEGIYNGNDTKGSSYHAAYNKDTGEWDATKTNENGDMYTGSFLVQKTNDDNFDVFDPNSDGWTQQTNVMA